MFSVMLLVGCKWADKMPDAKSKEGVAIHINRYDRVLDEYVSLNSYSARQKMNLEYPRQTKMLIEDVLNIGHVDDIDVEKRLRRLYLDSTVQVLLDEVHRQYVDISDVETQLGRAFKRLEKEDPKFRRPEVYTQIACLNQSVVVADTLVGISLDKYLGADFPLYARYFTESQCETMSRDHIVTDALTFYLLYHYVEPHRGAIMPTDAERIRAVARVHWVVAKILGISPLNHIPALGAGGGDINLSEGLMEVEAYMKQHPHTKLIELLTTGL